MTEREVACALTYFQGSPFAFTGRYIVRNVYHGLGFNHEVDLLSVNPKTLIGTEVEIKVTKSDLRRDAKKRHAHGDPRIRQLYFAGPSEMADAFFEHVPADAGIITVRRKMNYGEKGQARPWYECAIARRSKKQKSYRHPFTQEEVFQLLRLGGQRYWGLLYKSIAEGISAKWET